MGENADSQFSDLVNYGNRQETIGGCGDSATLIFDFKAYNRNGLRS